jgi:hypothetical protein
MCRHLTHTYWVKNQMKSLVQACRHALPYLATSAGMIELDNFIDVSPFFTAVLVPTVICGLVVIINRVQWERG